MCRPLVSTVVEHSSAAFGTPSQPIMAEYDTRTDEALSRLVTTLPSAASQILVAQLDEAVAEREDAMQDQPTPSLKHAHNITPDDCDSDEEHPLHASA